MNALMPEFLEYARNRAELSEGTLHEWNYRECKYCLMDYAELHFGEMSFEEIVNQWESINNN